MLMRLFIFHALGRPAGGPSGRLGTGDLTYEADFCRVSPGISYGGFAYPAVGLRNWIIIVVAKLVLKREQRMNEFELLKSTIKDFGNGKMIILTDDQSREDEGDLVVSADFITPEKVHFMLKNARGLLCVAMAYELVEQIGLPLHPRVNVDNDTTSPYFTYSIDLRTGISTGVSAHDRAKTIKALADPEIRITDFSSPGHVMPLRASKNGLLDRQGHTEASVEIAKLAGVSPIAVISEVLNEDGSSANSYELKCLADAYELHVISIKETIDFTKHADSRLINDLNASQ